MLLAVRVSLDCILFLQELESLLPDKPVEPKVGDEAEEVNMIDYESTRGVGGSQREAYDDSDDDEPSGHRVGCAHQ